MVPVDLKSVDSTPLLHWEVRILSSLPVIIIMFFHLCFFGMDQCIQKQEGERKRRKKNWTKIKIDRTSSFCTRVTCDGLPEVDQLALWILVNLPLSPDPISPSHSRNSISGICLHEGLWVYRQGEEIYLLLLQSLPTLLLVTRRIQRLPRKMKPVLG